MMNQEEIIKFEQSLTKISTQASEFGLDYYDMRFEICPSDVIYTFGAYGMPTRYAHWSFGKAFHRMKTQYDYNLSRIYELVINSDPCYAFLLDGNSLIQNQMVAAHVYAHSDFFKNNEWFRHTSRNMVETMARNAERIREYEFKYGHHKVEEFLDAALALQEHIEPRYDIGRPRPGTGPVRKTETPYDDLWNIGVKKEDDLTLTFKKLPEQPEKDVLQFIARHGKDLQDWERDIIFIIREEMLYFWPQIETKIMNEGWATLWHTRIMREMEMTEDETIEFAKMNAGVVQPGKMGINPYLLGLKMFEDIEKRYEKEKIYEVRANENDISFIRNYLTKELVSDLDLYLFQKVYTKWQVVETEWEKVREGLVSLLVNGGFPYIVVEDGNYRRNGELYLKHRHEGRDLDLYYMEKTLPYVNRLWARTVYLETVVDGRNILYSFDGEKMQKKDM